MLLLSKKRFFCCLLALFILCSNSSVYAAEPEVVSPSAILMEQSTGKVIYEKNSDERRSPASVTKIMTLYLIFEKLKSGGITLQDEVVTSAHAKSMGGSQVFLEEGEIQTVDTLIKCITVASGNDASVAMAEFVAGSEETFVEMMNEKANELGLTNSHFVDCCGLTEDTNHYMSARDIAVLSRELLNHYPEVFNYTKIWMEDITHVTAKGSSTFTLSNTNKLLKQYPYTTGLKTGSTSIAKYCLSATATKDNLNMIAVVMSAPDPKTRFEDSAKLLGYGFSVSRIYVDENPLECKSVPIEQGKSDYINIDFETPFQYLDTEGSDFADIVRDVFIDEQISAPLRAGDRVGEAIYRIGRKELGRVKIVSLTDVAEAKYLDYFGKVFRKYLL